MGVPIKENKCLFSFNYADYEVIIAQDADDLEFILRRLNTTYPTTYIYLKKYKIISMFHIYIFYINKSK
jgi:hypothetical protein